MIERADYEFMNKFDSNNSNERDKILNHPTEKYEVKQFLANTEKAD